MNKKIKELISEIETVVIKEVKLQKTLHKNSTETIRGKYHDIGFDIIEAYRQISRSGLIELDYSYKSYKQEDGSILIIKKETTPEDVLAAGKSFSYQLSDPRFLTIYGIESIIKDKGIGDTSYSTIDESIGNGVSRLLDQGVSQRIILGEPVIQSFLVDKKTVGPKSMEELYLITIDIPYVILDKESSNEPR